MGTTRAKLPWSMRNMKLKSVTGQDLVWVARIQRQLGWQMIKVSGPLANGNEYASFTRINPV